MGADVQSAQELLLASTLLDDSAVMCLTYTVTSNVYRTEIARQIPCRRGGYAQNALGDPPTQDLFLLGLNVASAILVMAA